MHARTLTQVQVEMEAKEAKLQALRRRAGQTAPKGGEAAAGAPAGGAIAAGPPAADTTGDGVVVLKAWFSRNAVKRTRQE